jgi:hypothetical protein
MGHHAQLSFEVGSQGRFTQDGLNQLSSHSAFHTAGMTAVSHFFQKDEYFLPPPVDSANNVKTVSFNKKLRQLLNSDW